MPSNYPKFQILSDLHLETPNTCPAYTYFSQPGKIPLLTSTLFLLGDIGLTRDRDLFTFLGSLLHSKPDLTIYYVLGNHEAYGMNMTTALNTMRTFEVYAREKFGQRFFFIDRRRVDYSDKITILGCTLWSRIHKNHARYCTKKLLDFDRRHGIQGRTLKEHITDHERDLKWLNDQVLDITTNQPKRQIIILTHHSPTTHPFSDDPVRLESPAGCAFHTDLSQEPCWTSEAVKLWAFGHTHYSYWHMDIYGERMKLVVSRQKGYAYSTGAEM